MARSQRDNQRSKVYAWEARATKGAHHIPTWQTLEQCEEFLRPIWRSERGRVGLAKQKAPELSRNLWGQRRATASSRHVLKLPKWSRNPWVVLHEAAHRLTPADEAHGPRFVGVLIGLVCRHMDHDGTELMQLADEMGVKYHVRSIGVVPVHGIRWNLERAVREQSPMTEMELACWLDVSYLQIRGAALGLIRAGTHRWLRDRLVSTAPPAAAAPPRRAIAPGPDSTKGMAKTHGIEIERVDGMFCVWPPKALDELGESDPFDGDHYADDWGQVDLMVRRYVQAVTGTWPTP